MTQLLEAFSVTAQNEEGLALLSQMHAAAFLVQGESPWSAQAFRKLLQSPGVEATAYTTGEEPVGLSLIRSVMDESEILSILVIPKKQKQGFGAQILKTELRKLAANAVAKVFLEVRQDNQSAVRLYESVGFYRLSVRKNYYKLSSGQRVDAGVYILEL